MYSKKLLGLLCGLLLLVSHAHALTFKAGDQASFTLTQKGEMKTEAINLQSTFDRSLTLDVKILSDNNQSYPFDVEITIKKLVDSITLKVKDKALSFAYDSTKAKNPSNTEELNKIINVPLYFTISEPFEVEETSDVLSAFEDEWDSPTEMNFYGASEDFYVTFLTQLFQLSGENLAVGKNYPISSYRFLDADMEEDDLEEDETLVHEGSFNITKIDKTTIHGAGKYFAKSSIKADKPEYESSETLSTNIDVNWNVNNALIQNRTNKLTGINSNYLFDATVKVTETWNAGPLN